MRAQQHGEIIYMNIDGLPSHSIWFRQQQQKKNVELENDKDKEKNENIANVKKKYLKFFCSLQINLKRRRKKK